MEFLPHERERRPRTHRSRVAWHRHRGVWYLHHENPDRANYPRTKTTSSAYQERRSRHRVQEGQQAGCIHLPNLDGPLTRSTKLTPKIEESPQGLNKREAWEDSLPNYNNTWYAQDKQTKKDDEGDYLDYSRNYSKKSNIVLRHSILRPAIVEVTITSVDELSFARGINDQTR